MNRTKRHISKSAARGTVGVVGAHNVEAAEVGESILKAGGNAYDAIVAMSFVTAVRETAMNSVGGVGVSLAYSASTGNVKEINFYGRTPSALSEDVFVPYLDSASPGAALGWRGVRGAKNERGFLAVGVPTFVAGLAELHASGATMAWDDLLKPAIELAREGFIPDEVDAMYAATHLRHLTAFEEIERVLLADGVPMPSGFYQGEGSRQVQSDLADTIETIAKEGPRAFYEGAIAEKIANYIQNNGGALSVEDMARYEPDVAGGLRGSYRGYDIVVSGGITGGVTLLEMLNLAEQFDLRGMDRWSGECLHLIVEIMRQAWTDRFQYVGDPTGATVPLDGLVSKQYARAVAPNLPLSGVPSDARPGDPWQFSTVARPAAPSAGGDPGGKNTTHLVAADGEGNLITLTQTLGMGYGSCVMVPETGVSLYNCTMWMNPIPGTPNSVGPWKTPAGHATPVIILKDGKPVAALGAPGGRRVVTSMFQVILNLIDYDMDLQAAIGAPRLHAEGANPADPTGAAVLDVLVDDQTPDEGIAALRTLGHNVRSVYETGTQNFFAMPLGVGIDGDGLIGGVDIYRKSVAIGV